MADLKLYKTAKEELKVMLIGLPLVAFGLLMIIEEPYIIRNIIYSNTLGWILTCFFVIAECAILFKIFQRKPSIVISETGILDNRMSQSELKWEQISEVIPIDILDNNLISLATDDTFIFKNNSKKLTAKVKKKVGSNFNIHLDQINIDNIELSNFINRLCKVSAEERRVLIRSSKVKSAIIADIDIKITLLYGLISILLVILALSSNIAFWVIMVLFGISVAIARFRPTNQTVRKYAEIGTWFGISYMALYLWYFYLTT